MHLHTRVLARTLLSTDLVSVCNSGLAGDVPLHSCFLLKYQQSVKSLSCLALVLHTVGGIVVVCKSPVPIPNGQLSSLTNFTMFAKSICKQSDSTSSLARQQHLVAAWFSTGWRIRVSQTKWL